MAGTSTLHVWLCLPIRWLVWPPGGKSSCAQLHSAEREIHSCCFKGWIRADLQLSKNVPTNYASVNCLPARPWRGSRNKLFSQQVPLRSGHLVPACLLSVVFSSAHQCVLRNASEQEQSPLQAGKMELSSSKTQVCREELQRQREHSRKRSTSEGWRIERFCSVKRKVKKANEKRSKYSGRRGKGPVVYGKRKAVGWGGEGQGKEDWWWGRRLKMQIN